MSSPYLGVSHIEKLNKLPADLEVGRAYFVDEEGYIVINHGRGPIIYGNRPGPQGQAGEPIPQLQDQIDYLTEAIFNILTEITQMTKSYDSAINILAQTIAKLYPETHSSEWKDPENATAEILTTENGDHYTIINERVVDGFYIVTLEPANGQTAQYLAQVLKAGDTVQVANSECDVVSSKTENGFVITELAQ